MKTFRKIHLWLSVPFGLIITLICFAGAMLVFEQEITRAARPGVYYVAEVKERPLDLGSIADAVARTLPDSVRITGITVFADPERTCRVNLSQPPRAAVFIDQYSGAVTGCSERLGFFATMFKLHRWLLDGKTGKLLVGISTIEFVIVLISGVVIWWPRARKNLRKALAIDRKHFWHSLHVAGGIYAALLVLAMALTGLTWSFGWYRSAFFAAFGAQEQKSRAPAAQWIDKKDATEWWQPVYDELKARYPGAPQITVGPETAAVTLSTCGNVNAADTYFFNEFEGGLEIDKRYSEAPKAEKLRGWIYSVHTGRFGGTATRILWSLAALLGATLPLTGYHILLRRL